MLEEYKSKVNELNERVKVKDWTRYLLEPSFENDIFPLNSLSVALGDIIEANVYILNNDGILHGHHETYPVKTGRIDNMIRKKELPYNFVNPLQNLKDTRPNIPIDDNMTMFPMEKRSNYADAKTTIIPVKMSGDRLGTVLIGTLDREMTDVEILVAEHAASLIGIELSFEQSIEEILNVRQKEQARKAWEVLSKSEKRAARGIFDEIGEETEIRLTTSDIADKMSITRSIVVNALQKLAIASIVDQQSMGMKGTYIKVLNPYFKESIHAN